MIREQDISSNFHREAALIRPTPEAVVREERDRILTVIAQQTNQALRAPARPDEIADDRESLRHQVIDSFVSNFVRFTSADQPIERLMALELMSETVLSEIDADLREYYMTQVARIDINAPVVTLTRETSISTAQLEMMAEHVTDEAISPPRGVAIERLQLAMQKARAFVVNKVVSH